jgi:predicted Zn-dependent protease
MKTVISLLFFLGIHMSIVANDYTDAWKALNVKDLIKAKALLQKAKADPNTAFEAYVTEIFLNTFNGKEENIDGFLETLNNSAYNNEYLYALWFNGSVLGQYGKKTKAHQLLQLEQIIKSDKYNGSLKAAAYYVRAMHFLFSNELTKAKQDWTTMGSILDWQLIGPFDNIAGTGYTKSHGPLEKPDTKDAFVNENNQALHWFTPSRLNKEGWIFTGPHIVESTGILYAQTFVYVPEETESFLSVGVNGSLKVWVNDGLVIANEKERVTELDYYKNKCRLNKGYNRVLVQLGFVDNSRPNFIVRFIDQQLNPIKGLVVTTTPQVYAKAENTENAAGLKHFAERLFEDKINKQPNDLLNFILLSQVYLRNGRTIEARRVIEQALTLAPGNPLLRFELLQSFSKSGNSTLLMQELERLKVEMPESYLVLKLDIDKLIEEQKYQEANDQLVKMITLYGDNEVTMALKIQILAYQEKIDELLKAVDEAYRFYPENLGFLQMMYRIRKNVNQDPKSAVSLLEGYLKNNYNYEAVNMLTAEYKAQGMSDKYVRLLETQNGNFGYDPQFATNLCSYYFDQQKYTKALEYAQAAIGLSPYTSDYWKNLAVVQEQINKNDAVESYKKAIYYNRTNYDARKKLNTLLGRPDLYKQLPQVNAYHLAKQKSQIDINYNFSYILDEKAVIIYDEGASEEYYTTIVRINNEKGIDSWKEYSISYGSYQSLLVEKAEVIKANSSKVPAEQNDGDIIFTGLESGDVIYIKYRLQNYTSGRMGKEFWDKFVFNAFQPCLQSRYVLITPKTFEYKVEVVNGTLSKSIREEGDFVITTWDRNDLPVIKSEPLMPQGADVGITIHLSSIKNWNQVAEWYSDLTHQNHTEDVDLNTLYNEIFKRQVVTSPYSKARLIYEYIVKNIRYSSISFRQSNLVPQPISKIINTKLGDCKDLSYLFMALADKAGLQTKLVLVSTRNNGVKSIILPSVEFNHCIIQLTIGNTKYHLELTDNNLPFASVPTNLHGALSLEIPRQGSKEISHLKPLNVSNRVKDKLVKRININIKGKDLTFEVTSIIYGALTSGYRDGYNSLSEDQLKESWLETLTSSNKNAVSLDFVKFQGLSTLSDSVKINYNYSVKNEVIEAGSMKMIKLPFLDVVASLDNFATETRTFPIEYADYENVDEYESIITIRPSVSQKFVEIPANQQFSFKSNSFSITYKKLGDTIVVHRIGKLERNVIESVDYAAFKKFLNDIIEAESKYLIFK